MKIQIKFRWSDKILFEGEYNSMKECLSGAVLSGADLSGADLSDAVLNGANLSGADLSDADLSGAVLNGANLSGADLSDADLSGANLSGADLSDADLSGAVLNGADLSDANLSGAVLNGAVLNGANLSGADLSGAVLSGAVLSGADLNGADLSDANLSGVPKIKNIHQAIYEAASQPNAFDMKDVHTCETTHCRAGWVVTLAGEGGAAMEYCLGWSAAAALIYIKSDPKLEKIPNFFADNETAMADMKRLAELEKAKAEGTAI